MPKEKFNDGQFDLNVFWGEWNNAVSIEIDSKQNFTFDEGEGAGPYTGLFMQFYSPKEIDRLIKVLQKAKKKTFKS